MGVDYSCLFCERSLGGTRVINKHRTVPPFLFINIIMRKIFLFFAFFVSLCLQSQEYSDYIGTSVIYNITSQSQNSYGYELAAGRTSYSSSLPGAENLTYVSSISLFKNTNLIGIYSSVYGNYLTFKYTEVIPGHFNSENRKWIESKQIVYHPSEDKSAYYAFVSANNKLLLVNVQTDNIIATLLQTGANDAAITVSNSGGEGSDKEHIVIMSNGNLTIYKDLPTSNDGHEYVDLGLPSGNLWAKYNLGAQSEYDLGNFYAFGETETKPQYMEDTYKWGNGTSNYFTKYNDSEAYGVVDYLTRLERADDAASVNWGGQWHTPTQADFIELWNSCSWEWVWGEISGYKATSIYNGKTLFFPAAGYVYWYNQYSNEWGYYMTSEITWDGRIWLFCFSADQISTSWMNVRYQGYSVRPVSNSNYSSVKGVEIDVPQNDMKKYDTKGVRRGDNGKGVTIVKAADGSAHKVLN